MTLVLEIEYLSGVSFAAVGPDSEAPDWPPQPDRIFSALVASWAARGRDKQEASALEWLERLPPPRVLAPDAEPRTSVTVFVPPNDPRSDRQKNAKGVVPSLRGRQPRRFPATRPHDPIVKLLWVDADPDEAMLVTLGGLARDTAYVGHSASLTRCRFLRTDATSHSVDASMPRRRIYPGRFAELCRTFEVGRRPLVGARHTPLPDARKKQASMFEPRWLVLEHVTGDMPDVRACASVAKVIRNALLSGYQRIGRGDRVPAEVSGHSPNGAPTREPHLAIVPLPFTGFPHADGQVMGFALIPRRDSAILDHPDFRQALRTVAPVDEDHGRRILTVKPEAGTTSHGAFCIGLSPTFEASKRSLDPMLYLGPARTFATITPLVLDRHLKEKGEARQGEIEAQISAACRNIGLPDPEQVVADKHSAFEGVPSADPSSRSPPWMRWRLPQSLASRHLTHAVLRFAAPLDGPVILGAGRFVGLGLCRPLDRAG